MYCVLSLDQTFLKANTYDLVDFDKADINAMVTCVTQQIVRLSIAWVAT